MFCNMSHISICLSVNISVFCPQVFTEIVLKSGKTVLENVNHCDYKSEKETKTIILNNIV